LKTRNFFVSNSSSSSFIVLGFSFKNEDLEDMENYEEFEPELYDNFTVLSGSDDGVPEGETVLGIDLYEFDDCGDMCSENTYTLSDITEKLVELRSKMRDIMDLEDEDISEPAIFGGTKCC